MKKILALVLSITILCLTFSVVSANSQTFTVPAGSSEQVSLNLNGGDSVTGTISVSGGSGNDVNFKITDSNGNIISSQDRITSTSFSFTASTSGTYKLSFDNSFSVFSSKSVSLDYSVQSPLLGGGSSGGFVSLLLIVALVAIVIAVVVVVIVVVVRKTVK